MLKNFVFGIAKAEKNWSMENYIESTVKNIKETVGDKKVILGLSKVKNYLIIKNGQKEISDEEIETFFN